MDTGRMVSPALSPNAAIVALFLLGRETALKLSHRTDKAQCALSAESSTEMSASGKAARKRFSMSSRVGGRIEENFQKAKAVKTRKRLFVYDDAGGFEFQADVSGAIYSGKARS